MSRTLPVIPADVPAEATPPPFERIAIVGFGLIGGSIALAARRRWRGGLIIAIDRKDVLEAAMRVHAADVGGDDLVMAAEAELIVLAAPVRQNLRVIEQLDRHIAGPALVTDVGSTKTVISAAARRLPEQMRFIGGHPLAGGTAGGFAAARSDLFDGRPWLLTPPADTPLEIVVRLEALIVGLGAVPSRIDPEAHDRLIAYLSHLPQLTASALMQVVGAHAGSEGLALAGRGLRDTTRLATSPPGIWRDIAGTNIEAIRAALDELISVLERLRDDLAAGDELERVFHAAAEWKRTLDPSGPTTS